ncbi:MAG: DUF1521 domain-containing protein [Pseudomonadota bacterium]
MTTVNPATSSALLAPDCRCVEPPRTFREANGNVTFENENYTITTTDNGTINISNKDTGEHYRIWGDPHVAVDGKHAFDFWGQTTFILDDGTKITVETLPWNGNPNMTVAAEVTITDGDYGVHLTGVDPMGKNDLEFYEANGYLMDAVVRDGNILLENFQGEGFVAIDSYGNVVNVDQAYINGTDEHKLENLIDTFARNVFVFGGLVSMSFAGGFLMGMMQGLAIGDDTGAQNNFLLQVARANR